VSCRQWPLHSIHLSLTTVLLVSNDQMWRGTATTRVSTRSGAAITLTFLLIAPLTLTTESYVLLTESGEVILPILIAKELVVPLVAGLTANNWSQLSLTKRSKLARFLTLSLPRARRTTLHVTTMLNRMTMFGEMVLRLISTLLALTMWQSKSSEERAVQMHL
jgi:hypothetical protein